MVIYPNAKCTPEYSGDCIEAVRKTKLPVHCRNYRLNKTNVQLMNNQMQSKDHHKFMLNLLRCAVVLSLSFFVCSPALNTAQAQPLPERRPLSGRVVTSNNTPIKGATVTIRQQTDIAPATFWGARVATDANGEFSFPDAEEGAYYITIVSTGFAPLQNKSYIVDATTPSLLITLERLATLPLHVLKPDNTALAGAMLTVRMQADQLPSLPLLRVTTDANGNTTLPGLLPGNYLIQAVAEGVGVVTLRNVEVRYVVEPKTLDVQLKAGGTLRVVARESQADNEPRPVGGATITFTTAASLDTEAAKAPNLPDDMMLYVMQSMQSMQAVGGSALVTRDGDGVLQVADVAPGTYTVRLFSPLHKPVVAQTVEVKAGETATAEFLAEATSPPAVLTILVRDIKDKPIADTEFFVQLRPGAGGNTFGPGAPPPAPEVPQAIRNLFGGGNFIRRGRTDKDGTLTLYPVQLGKWRVTLIVPPTPEGNPGSSAKDVTVTAQGGTVTIPITLPAPAAK